MKKKRGGGVNYTYIIEIGERRRWEETTEWRAEKGGDEKVKRKMFAIFHVAESLVSYFYLWSRCNKSERRKERNEDHAHADLLVV